MGPANYLGNNWRPVADPNLVIALNDGLIQAVSRLVDDWQNPREPSHSDIGSALARAGLSIGDPHKDPAAPKLGKQKRVRQALAWAMDNDELAGSRAVAGLIEVLRGCGGFLSGSRNYCGEDAINTCVVAFNDQPAELTNDGILRVRNLAALSGRELTVALRSYVTRAQKGFEDSVLLAGTDKDIIEATAAHVVAERFGSYPTQADFPHPPGSGVCCGRSRSPAIQDRVGGDRRSSDRTFRRAVPVGVCRQSIPKQGW